MAYFSETNGSSARLPAQMPGPGCPFIINELDPHNAAALTAYAIEQALAVEKG